MFRVLLALLILTLASPAAAITINVNPMGTGDAPTIAAALSMADPGDDVLLALGTYNEAGLTMPSGVTLHSADGAEGTIIDGNQLNYVIFCSNNDAQTLIEGITITGGMGGSAGGVVITNGSDTVVRQCIITGNVSTNGAGGIIWGTSGFDDDPTIELCVIAYNTGSIAGGLMASSDKAFGTVSNCTLYGNQGAGLLSSAFYLGADSQPAVDNCIIAYSPGGTAAVGGPSTAMGSFDCCCVFGNDGGDVLSPDFGTIGPDNFFLDPWVCDPLGGDWGLAANSPCLPAFTNGCGLVGAANAACPAVAIDGRSWGAVKAGYGAGH